MLLKIEDPVMGEIVASIAKSMEEKQEPETREKQVKLMFAYYMRSMVVDDKTTFCQLVSLGTILLKQLQFNDDEIGVIDKFLENHASEADEVRHKLSLKSLGEFRELCREVRHRLH